MLHADGAASTLPNGSTTALPLLRPLLASPCLPLAARRCSFRARQPPAHTSVLWTYNLCKHFACQSPALPGGLVLDQLLEAVVPAGLPRTFRPAPGVAFATSCHSRLLTSPVSAPWRLLALPKLVQTTEQRAMVRQFGLAVG